MVSTTSKMTVRKRCIFYFGWSVEIDLLTFIESTGTIGKLPNKNAAESVQRVPPEIYGIELHVSWNTLPLVYFVKIDRDEVPQIVVYQNNVNLRLVINGHWKGGCIFVTLYTFRSSHMNLVRYGKIYVYSKVYKPIC